MIHWDFTLLSYSEGDGGHIPYRLFELEQFNSIYSQDFTFHIGII